MSRPCPVLQLAFFWLFTASLGAIAAGGEPAVEPTVSLSPEAEAKLASFYKAVGEAKRNLWRERMTREVEAVRETAQLTPEKAKSLQLVADEAADLAVRDWLPKLQVFVNRQLAQQPALPADAFAQMLPQADSFAREDIITDFVPPQEHPAWQAGLKKVLSAGELGRWQDEQDQRRAVLLKEIAEFIKPNVEQARETYLRAIQGIASNLSLTLGLTAEQSAELEKLGRSATEESVAGWCKKVESNLLGMSDDQRQVVLKRKRYYADPTGEFRPDERSAWKEGLKALLSPAEQERLKLSREERQKRRAAALGQVLLALLDDKVGFTAAQRQSLQPLSEKLVLGESTLFPTGQVSSYASFPVSSFFRAANQAAAAEAQPLLDPAQWTRWQQLRSDPDTGVASRRRAIRLRNGVESPSEPSPESPAPSAVEPEDLERSISEFLHHRTQQERQRVLSTMLLKVEDAARVSRLEPQASRTLQTAARGAAEETLVAWRRSVEQTVRSSLGNLPARDIPQRLASIEDYNFQRGGEEPADKQKVWETAVSLTLSETQRQTWRQEKESRLEFRCRAIALSVVAEFDRRYFLTSEQAARLTAPLSKIVREYAEDFGNYYSSSDETPWFLQGYMMIMPLAGVPEPEMKSIITKEQWERWTKSEEYGNCTNMWTNLQQNHASRVRQRNP